MTERAGAESVILDSPATGGTSATPADGASRRVPPLGGQLLQRALAIPGPVLAAVAIGIVIAGQVAEDLSDSPPLQMLPPNVYLPRWMIVVAFAYMLLVIELIERPVQRSLGLVQHVVRIDPAEFRAYWLRMSYTDHRSEAILFACAAGIVTLLYPVLNRPLATTIDPVTRGPVHLPAGPLEATLVLAAYTLVGWAGLRLVYRIIRVARALGQLSRQPLVIDVYDVTDLLPFGRIALALSLAPVGLMLVLIMGLGAPQGPVAWLVLSLATTASILALVLPLRGIHRQMAAARQAATSELNRELREAHREFTDGAPHTPEEIGELANRTGALINLRRVVGEMPSWPFRDTVAFARAMLIASAPLIYTVLSELIRVFLISPLEG